MARVGRRQRRGGIGGGGGGGGFDLRWRGLFSSHKTLSRLLLIALVCIALLPPLFLHFRLRRLRQIQTKRCGWLKSPPLVCAHGGDSTNAFPNTIAAYQLALRSHVDCIEIDVSRSADGILFALHDRDLQHISGNSTSKVGYLSKQEISQSFHDQKVPTTEEALMLVSSSVRLVILDAKVGPPSYEKGLAKDILSVIRRTGCTNCVVWAKSDNLVRDIIKLSPDVMVGYIVMKDPATGARTNLLRMKAAQVVGIYHQLIDANLMRILHQRAKKVYAWTVDDLDSMEKMLHERVDGVVTSNPEMFQRLMQDLQTECLESGMSLW